MMENEISMKIFIVRDYEEHSKSEVGDFGQQDSRKTSDSRSKKS